MNPGLGQEVVSHTDYVTLPEVPTPWATILLIGFGVWLLFGKR